MPIKFVGEIQKVNDGRDTKNCWVDVTIRMPVAANRVNLPNEEMIREAYRNRSVIGGELEVLDVDLFADSGAASDPGQGKMTFDDDDDKPRVTKKKKTQ